MKHLATMLPLLLIGVVIGTILGFKLHELMQTSLENAITEEKFVTAINNWRYKEGLAPYIRSDTLCRFSDERLQEVKTENNHNGFYKMVERVCSSNCVYGENLATGVSSSEAMEKWLASKLHRDNLLDPRFTHTCISTDGYNVVHIFGNK